MADIETIDEALARYVAAVESRSAGAIAATFSEGAVLEHVTGSYRGRDDIERFYREHNLGAACFSVTETGRAHAPDGVAVELVLHFDDRTEHVGDFFDVDDDGLIGRLAIYGR